MRSLWNRFLVVRAGPSLALSNPMGRVCIVAYPGWVQLGYEWQHGPMTAMLEGAADKKAILCMSARGCCVPTVFALDASWSHECLLFLCLGPRCHVGGKPHPVTTTTTTTVDSLEDAMKEHHAGEDDDQAQNAGDQNDDEPADDRDEHIAKHEDAIDEQVSAELKPEIGEID